MKNAYHGSSHGALSLMSDPYFSNFYRPLLPGIEFAEFNNEQSLSIIDEEVAAVVIEPIQGEAGYIAADTEFLNKVREKCTEKGCLLIFDEIQTGMGRTGKLFALEQYNGTQFLIPSVLARRQPATWIVECCHDSMDPSCVDAGHPCRAATRATDIRTTRTGYGSVLTGQSSSNFTQSGENRVSFPRETWSKLVDEQNQSPVSEP